VLQCVAVCCSVFVLADILSGTICVAVCYSALHYVAVCCSVFLEDTLAGAICVLVCCSMLQCVAVCFNVLQCVCPQRHSGRCNVCCSVLQCVALCRSAGATCVAVCYSA